MGGKPCLHCGTPIPHGMEGDFCCAGCDYVHRLIVGEGFEKFYDLRDRTMAPVKPLSLEKKDYAWLETAQSEAETRGRDIAQIELQVHGLACVGCIWLIEKLFSKHAGAVSAQVDIHLGRLRLRWRVGESDLSAFASELQRFGYRLGPATEEGGRSESSELLRLIGLGAAFAMNNMLFTVPFYLGMSLDHELAKLFLGLAAFFATLNLMSGGVYFMRRAWLGLRQGMLHMDLPISLGIIFAYIGSVAGWVARMEGLLYFDFVALFICLMLVGRWMQEHASERHRNNARRINPMPGSVLTRAGGESDSILPVDRIEPGLRYGVASGGVVPVYSTVVSRAAAYSLEWIDGEAEPRSGLAGSTVPAGAVNISATILELESLEGWENSLLSKLTSGVAAPTVPPSFQVVLKLYTAVVLCIAASAGVWWWMTTGVPLRAVQVVISVLVVSCPCSLGLAAPLAIELATAALRRHGVFVREPTLWARLPRVRHVVFDKTGTLTLETPQLVNRDILGVLTAQDQQALWWLVDANLHPVARSLRAELLCHAPRAGASPQVAESIGQGVSVEVEGRRYSLGKIGWGGSGHGGAGGGWDAEFCRDQEVVARFILEEKARPGATAEVSALRALGMSVAILSGDRPEKVSAMASSLGLPPSSALSGMSPAAKADWVRHHTAGAALMIGDGANDSLAFDAALCRGTPVVDKGVLENKADFYFLGGDLSGVRRLFEVARARRIAMVSVFSFAVCYNLMAVGISLSGHMSPLLAALLMPSSSIFSMALATAILKGADRSSIRLFTEASGAAKERG